MPDVTFASHLGRAKVDVVILPRNLKMLKGTVQEVNDLKNKQTSMCPIRAEDCLLFPQRKETFLRVGQSFPHR